MHKYRPHGSTSSPGKDTRWAGDFAKDMPQTRSELVNLGILTEWERRGTDAPRDRKRPPATTRCWRRFTSLIKVSWFPAGGENILGVSRPTIHVLPDG